jgi:hypothetical protein
MGMIDWGQLAWGVGEDFRSACPERDRGVWESVRHGVSAVIVPADEQPRVTAEFAAAGVEVVGVHRSPLLDEPRMFVALVRSTDAATLNAIARCGESAVASA